MIRCPSTIREDKFNFAAEHISPSIGEQFFYARYEILTQEKIAFPIIDRLIQNLIYHCSFKIDSAIKFSFYLNLAIVIDT